MTQTSLSPRALFELLFLGLLWGGSFLAIRTALDEIGPLTSVLWRVGLAAGILWAVIWLRGGGLPERRVWGPLLVMGILNNVLPFTLMAWAQVHIPSGLTSILNAATAIFGVLVAALVFADERLSWQKGAGVGLGFAGVIAVIGPGALAGFSLTSLAQIAVLAGTLSYAFASAWARATLSQLPPEQAAAGMLTGATLIMLPLTFAVEGVPSLSLGAATWGGILYYAVLATALAYLLYYRVLRMAGAGNLMLVTLIIPPVAVALGAWVRAETLGPNAWIGFAALAAGLILISRASRATI